MEKNIKIILKDLATFLGINNERTAEEKLQFCIEELTHQTRLDRIKEIRNESGYVPNYNKPKIHTEIIILCQESPIDTFRPINSRTKETQRRSPEFENNMGLWLEKIKEEAKSQREKLIIREEEYKKAIEERYREKNKFLNKFLKVN